jgi:hypothetical protein
LRNLNLINNECLAANIVITARPTTGAVTRAVPKIFRINVPISLFTSERGDSNPRPLARKAHATRSTAELTVRIVPYY